VRDLNEAGFQAAFARRQLAAVEAIPTHLPKLNKACRDDGGGVGLAPGWFVTVGANPGFGKSAFALNLTARALQHGVSVGYVSLEMTAQQLAARYYAITTNSPIRGLERGTFSETRFAEVRQKIRDMPPLWVPETIGGAWEDVAIFVKDCHEQGCTWFVLDYLQLVQIGDDENIGRAITSITTDLRAWAANEGATVVVLSQFNRVTSSEYRQRPRSQGLWGGMILEASSDLVLLLDHSRYHRAGSVARTWLVIDKNRHGPVGEVPVLWDYRTLTMREGLADEENEWPE